MLKKISSIFLILLSLSAFCDDFISGQGKFISKDSDRLSFVKEQLLYEAYLDVANKAMLDYGLDAQTFWKNFNSSLASSLDAYEKNILDKYKAEGKDLSRVEDDIRQRKLNFKRRYGNVRSLIQSYSVKSMTRSSNNPNYRYIKIDAKVNKENLSKFFYRFMGNKTTNLIDSLYMNIEFDNKLFNYSEIGVDKDSDFTSVIKDNWEDWFEKNKPSNIKNLEILTEDEAQELEKLAGNKEQSDLSNKYSNSLYLKIVVQMKKTSYNAELNSYSFYFSVNGFVMDIKSNRVIKSFNVDEEEKVYESIKMETFSSTLANHIYRMPMTSFSELIQKFKNLRALDNDLFVNLINYKNLGQVYNFRSELSKRGIKYSLQSVISKLSAGQARLDVSSSANLLELKTLVNSIYSGKNSTQIELIETQGGIGIKFM